MRAAKSFLPVVFSAMVIVCLHTNAYSLEKDTHYSLNKTISEGNYNGFSLDDYLKNELGMESGLNAILNSKTIEAWVAYGGEYEDEPFYTRSLNHFHDPLKSWGSAGFKGIGASSIVWGQYLRGTQIINGNYSWNDTRDYFYYALTGTNKDACEANYANCFRGLGQLMHLVQDASVPAHTRDDFHKVFHYETWLLAIQNEDPAIFNSFVGATNVQSVKIDSSIYRKPDYAETPAPIAHLIDNNVYDGTNPDVTTGTNVGLAEYTNANFLSEDTRFEDYPYPSWNSVERMYIQIPDPADPAKIVYRPYYTKARDGDTSFYLLATVGYLSEYVHTHFPYLDYEIRKNEKPALDENVYDNYARRLIPRAVAYSSELLRYFFRGDIDAVDAKTVKDGSNNITGITMKVKNNTPNEAISNGGFVVSCRYTKDGAKHYGNSGQPASYDANPDHEYSFTFSDPIPSDAADLQYLLVYRGKLGAEDEAVAGKNFKPKNALMIDDWERNEVLWDSKDPRSTLSIVENEPQASGKKSMKMSIVSASPGEEAIYESIPTADYHWFWGWEYYSPCKCMLTDEIGQFLSSVAGRRITRMKMYLCNWNSYPYEVILQPRIYIRNANLPGELLASGNETIIRDTDLPYRHNGYATVNFTFPDGGVSLPEGKEYNITVKSLRFTKTSRDPSPVMPMISSPTRFFANWCYGGNVTWYSEPNFGLAATIYAIGAGPSALREISKDCSKYGSFLITIKSDLTGNVLDFIYGENKDNIINAHLNLGFGLQEIKIPISSSIDKSKLGYFAFKLGTDGIDADGKSKQNTIYIDQLEAE